MDIINKFSTVHTTAKPNREIKYIVVHYTAGVTSRAGSAINTAEYYRTNDREVSADYSVDDTAAVCYNGDINNRYTWHCGGSKYNTKGGTFYGKCTNANAIGVEICSTNSTGKMQSGEKPQEVRILQDKVLVASDVHEVTVEETVMHEYTQTEYSKDEYIGYMQNRLAQTESQTTDIELALVELYEGVLSNG